MEEKVKKRDLGEVQRRYLLDIDLYERTFKPWESRGRKIVKRYRDERNLNFEEDAKYNILWSNVQTIMPAVFSKLPKPDVSRRHKDDDPIARVASLILERALEFEVESYPDYGAAVKYSVEDRLLPGRGTAWIRYEPVIKSEEYAEEEGENETSAVQDEIPAEEVDDYGEKEPTADFQEPMDRPRSVDVIDYECTPVDYVHWDDFGHNVSKTWEEVTIVWRKVALSRKELKARFGNEKGGKIALDQKSDIDDDDSDDNELKKATIYEIWDKSEKIVIWLSKSEQEALEVADDPLQLYCFFPCPPPLYATITTSSLIPVADFVLYQDQADELDLLCERINGLIDALKVVGVYDATQTAIKRLLQEGTNNQLIPVDNWLAFGEKGGIKGTIDFLPLDQVVGALNAAYLARDQSKQVIYEITGISDIIRGASNPNETLGAQRLKGDFASKRLKRLQDGVNAFATEILKIKAEIICKHYQPENILKIAGAMQLPKDDQQYVVQAMLLLKSEQIGNFRIEISSDSMVETDDQQEKENRMEFLNVISGFLEKAVAAPPEMAPLLGDMLMYCVRGFKVGKSIEGSIDTAVKQMQKKIGQPDPEAEAAKADQQAEQAKIQQRLQSDMAKIQAESQSRQAEIASQVQLEQAKQQTQAQQEQLKLQAEIALKQAQIAAESEAAAAKLQVEAELEIRKMELQAQIDREKMGAQIAADQQKSQFDQECKREEMAQSAAQAAATPVQGELPGMDNITKVLDGITKQLMEIGEDMSAPIKYERGSDGKVAGITKGKRKMIVSYDMTGKPSGIS